MLRNIRVIGIDQRLQSKPGEAVVAHTATFEVTPKQSEVISLASEMGKVSLSLRSLVPAAHELPGAAAAATAKTDEVKTAAAADSSIGDDATYTTDSEISPLLQKQAAPTGKKVMPEFTTVTILRGSGKTSEAKAPEPASKGQ